MIEHFRPPNEPRLFWRLTFLISLLLLLILAAFFIAVRRLA